MLKRLKIQIIMRIINKKEGEEKKKRINIVNNHVDTPRTTGGPSAGR